MGVLPFSYDVTTQRGLVRLFGIDADGAYNDFNDTEIDAFISSTGHTLLAAAQVLDTKAAKIIVIQGVTKFAGIMVDGSKAADALHLRAIELRRQVYEGDDGAGLSPITWAEMVLDPFSFRERMVNEMLRLST